MPEVADVVLEQSEKVGVELFCRGVVASVDVSVDLLQVDGIGDERRVEWVLPLRRDGVEVDGHQLTPLI